MATAPSAISVIKSYSPELIVAGCTSFPLILADERYISGELDFILERVNAAVVGPGLSRDSTYVDVALKICERLAKKKTPIVFDGVLLPIVIVNLGRYLSFPISSRSLQKLSICDYPKCSRAYSTA